MLIKSKVQQKYRSFQQWFLGAIEFKQFKNKIVDRYFLNCHNWEFISGKYDDISFSTDTSSEISWFIQENNSSTSVSTYASISLDSLRNYDEGYGSDDSDINSSRCSTPYDHSLYSD